jgi:hypothetical protein
VCHTPGTRRLLVALSLLPGPCQGSGVTTRVGYELLHSQGLPGPVAQGRSMGVTVGVNTDHQAGFSGTAHASSFIGDAGTTAPAWKGTPAAIL